MRELFQRSSAIRGWSRGLKARTKGGFEKASAGTPFEGRKVEIIDDYESWHWGGACSTEPR